MGKTGKTVVKAEIFWADAEATAAAFEAGTDEVAQALVAVTTPEEAVVES